MRRVRDGWSHSSSMPHPHPRWNIRSMNYITTMEITISTKIHCASVPSYLNLRWPGALENHDNKTITLAKDTAFLEVGAEQFSRSIGVLYTPHLVPTFWTLSTYYYSTSWALVVEMELLPRFLDYVLALFLTDRIAVNIVSKLHWVKLTPQSIPKPISIVESEHCSDI
jgi:hypothetical protein